MANAVLVENMKSLIQTSGAAGLLDVEENIEFQERESV